MMCVKGRKMIQKKKKMLLPTMNIGVADQIATDCCCCIDLIQLIGAFEFYIEHHDFGWLDFNLL